MSDIISIPVLRVLRRGLCGYTNEHSEAYTRYCDRLSCSECWLGSQRATTKQELINWCKEYNIHLDFNDEE